MNLANYRTSIILAAAGMFLAVPLHRYRQDRHHRHLPRPAGDEGWRTYHIKEKSLRYNTCWGDFCMCLHLSMVQEK